MGNLVHVRWSLRRDDLRGEVVSDQDGRSKIVFLSGYMPEKKDDYLGTLPKDGEEYLCSVVRDTKPDDRNHGALIVRLQSQVEERYELRPVGPVLFGAQNRAPWKVRGQVAKEVPSYRHHSLPEQLKEELNRHHAAWTAAVEKAKVELALQVPSTKGRLGTVEAPASVGGLSGLLVSSVESGFRLPWRFVAMGQEICPGIGEKRPVTAGFGEHCHISNYREVVAELGEPCRIYVQRPTPALYFEWQDATGAKLQGFLRPNEIEAEGFDVSLELKDEPGFTIEGVVLVGEISSRITDVRVGYKEHRQRHTLFRGYINQSCPAAGQAQVAELIKKSFRPLVQHQADWEKETLELAATEVAKLVVDIRDMMSIDTSLGHSSYSSMEDVYDTSPDEYRDGWITSRVDYHRFIIGGRVFPFPRGYNQEMEAHDARCLLIEEQILGINGRMAQARRDLLTPVKYGGESHLYTEEQKFAQVEPSSVTVNLCEALEAWSATAIEIARTFLRETTVEVVKQKVSGRIEAAEEVLSIAKEIFPREEFLWHYGVLEKVKKALTKRPDRVLLLMDEFESSIAPLQARIAEREAKDEAFRAALAGPVVHVGHFHGQWMSGEQAVDSLGLKLPESMAGKVSGVSGVEKKTLLPGTKAVVAIRIGPGGGKRYGYDLLSETGLTRLGSEMGSKYNQETVLYRVDSPDWAIAWTTRHDGVTGEYCLANAGGIHSYRPMDEGALDDWSRNQPRVHSEPWVGVAVQTPSEENMRKLFGLSSLPAHRREKVTPAAPAPQLPVVQTADLPVSFRDEGKRYFRHSTESCTSAHRLTSSEYQAYLSGTLTVVECSFCRKLGKLPERV